MDISSISGISMVEDQDPRAKAGSQEIDRDAFIKMFLAQMKHQDPLNPMDGSEFAAQLAQFTSLEQLYNVNQTLEDLQALQETGSRFETLALMGKEIVAEGNGISLDQDGPATGGFELPQGAHCSVAVTDANGLAVSEMDLGPLEPGSHRFEWDGKSGSGVELPQGTYYFSVSAVTPYGEEVKAVPHIVGRVDKVSLQEGGSTLFVGQIPVETGSVLDVKEAGSSDAGATTAGQQDPIIQEVGI